ncbi:MAG: hypothetical protein ACIAXF_11405 [Phycisphaerales bacterium JB063]
MKRIMPLFVMLAMLFSTPAWAQADSPLVGAWDAVSQGGNDLPEGAEMWVENRADGTGTMHFGTESMEYTWSHDQAAETCTITADGETMTFKVAFEDDTVTYTDPENPDDTMVMRRRPAE